MSDGSAGGLADLARLYGVQTSYHGSEGRLVRPSRTAVVETLRALGAPLEREDDIRDAARHRGAELWNRPVAPALVAWDGRLDEIRLRVPAGDLGGPYRATVTLEDGSERAWHARRVGVGQAAEIGGTEHVELTATDRSLLLPLGYHRLDVRLGRREGHAVVISAPRRAPSASDRTWGTFLPLYALFTRRSWGVGDLSDLGDLAEWAAGLGGRAVATLPLLASFNEGPLFDPSPYSPASRLFWNELFVDVTASPDLRHSADARALVESDAFRRDLARARRGELVDHRAVMGLKRRVLQLLAAEAFARAPRRAEMTDLTRTLPRLGDYAAFRAAAERHGTAWTGWPAAERDGRLPTGGGDAAACRYHRYVQVLAEEQMSALERRADRAGCGVHFDFPVGVNPAGYDAWREREAFAFDATTGAPPDAFFGGGQDWGVPPLHPDRIRDQGYRYVIESFRHLCRHARVVRLDHVMWLHRLFWIPRGVAPNEGTYVRYPAEELYAILALEAHRAGTVMVGEDLGTVPAEVRRSMARHGLARSYVAELEVSAERRPPVPPPSRRSVASLNTHDLPPFAAFWRDADPEIRAAVGRMLGAHRRWPTMDPSNVLREAMEGVLRYLASSEARIVVVNLEDLWLDPRPQNVPGTREHPNWRRRARHGLEGFRDRQEVTTTLSDVDSARKRGRARAPARPSRRTSAKPHRPDVSNAAPG
ncbi:MAG: 4-alpha-glucanotransferase [Actinomycetota bacterium]